MPERPRSHVLEDESFVAFRAALPTVWVFREVGRQDYGIDGEVEIFTAEGGRTGKRFFVQLRATDASDLRRALVTRFSLQTAEYYRALDGPLLVVRYLSRGSALYARWFHSFDSHYGGESKRSFTFRLAATDRWRSDTAENLVRGMDAFRRFRASRLEPPVLLHLTGAEDSPLASELLLAIRRLLSDIPDTLSATTETPRHGDAHLVVGRKAISIHFADVASATAHYEREAPADVEAIANDAITTAALGLHMLGHPHLASEVAEVVAARSTLILLPDVALALSESFSRARRLVASLDVADVLLERDEVDATLSAGFFTLPVLMARPRLTVREQEAYESFLRRRVERESRSDEGTAHYTLGNFLRTSGRPREAFKEYRRAARADRQYPRRPYYCRELGSVLFLLEHYALASSVLAAALALGDEPRTHALHGEALFFAGRLAEACAAFEALFASPAADHPLARLQYRVADELRVRFGDVVTRHKAEAEEHAGVSTGSNRTETEEGLARALELDPLCGLAWFNLGVHLKEGGREREGLFPFLVTSVVQQWDVEGWVNLIAICFTSGDDDELFIDALRAGHSLNGTELLAQFRTVAHAQPEGFPAEEAIAAFDQVLASLPQDESEVELRMVDAASPEYVALRLSREVD